MPTDVARILGLLESLANIRQTPSPHLLDLSCHVVADHLDTADVAVVGCTLAHPTVTGTLAGTLPPNRGQERFELPLPSRWDDTAQVRITHPDLATFADLAAASVAPLATALDISHLDDLRVAIAHLHQVGQQATGYDQFVERWLAELRTHVGADRVSLFVPTSPEVYGRVATATETGVDHQPDALFTADTTHSWRLGDAGSLTAPRWIETNTLVPPSGPDAPDSGPSWSLLAPVSFQATAYGVLVLTYATSPQLGELIRHLVADAIQPFAHTIEHLDSRQAATTNTRHLHASATRLSRYGDTLTHEIAGASLALESTLRQIQTSRDRRDDGTTDKLLAAAVDLSQLVQRLPASIQSAMDGNTIITRREPITLDALATTLLTGHHATLTLHSPGVTVVHTDTPIVTSAVGNLLRNAWKYGIPPVELRLDATDETFTIDVIDHGPGMDDDQLTVAMAWRRTSDEAGDGSGLGLPIAAAVSRHLGGRLTYRRPEGRSAFRLTLPRV